ncbi:hypothetical protein [Moorena sp. SIO3H5]|uniref:hypothetical protein n=1 Tax=Moorena sp. SIO3H5 TaxID=2607834 RepID=UPI0013B877C8|nr:hypothetical protein [Moorena sp. SIO3H5]NEO70032.1 hypothetical protein [Moorena sp. SIO3H5]
MPTNALCKLHDLSAALPTIHELGIVTGKMPVPLPTPDSRLPTGNCNRQDACSTPDSRLPTPDSRLPTPDSRLGILTGKMPVPLFPVPDNCREV